MKLVDISIKKPVTVTVGAILLLLFGLLALVRIPIQLTPNVDLPECFALSKSLKKRIGERHVVGFRYTQSDLHLHPTNHISGSSIGGSSSSAAWAAASRATGTRYGEHET